MATTSTDDQQIIDALTEAGYTAAEVSILLQWWTGDNATSARIYAAQPALIDGMMEVVNANQ